ncbi:hypothetical protein MAM1_0252c08753 [Mucor ambiguus]|uniref:F-box domain-containing protein n=1 Tax=Mucor ambiguus TaxID=91626 RepID=A0A0C9MP37_9FUNG|nr:hypothetical protein MAM1_0252c08753 [Mucor ambiguus]
MCWDQLPFEILQRIFYFCNLACDHYPDKRDAFIDLQLVCKSWHKAAYEALYQDVYLAESHTKFGDIVASQVGPLVKRVTFLYDFLNNKKACAIVHSIMEHCPNIEEIHTASDTERNLVWPLLMSPSSKMKKVKTLGEEGCNAFDTNVYTDLALKYKDSFTQLYLLNNNANSNIHMDELHSPLVRHLNKFTALQHLIVNSTFRFSHESLDQLLNDCPPTLHRLVFEKMRLVDDTPLPTDIEPMTHAKQLSISQCDIYATSLLYLTRKLKGLEELELDYVCSQSTGSWWNQLNELCLPVQVYEIGIKLVHEHILSQLDNCFSLIQKSVPMQSANNENNKRELHIHSLEEDDYLGLIGYNVRLTRARDAQIIVIDPYSFGNVSIVDILNLAKQYLPTSIHVGFENLEDIYQTFLARDADDKNTKQILLADEIKDIMIQHHNVDVNNSWQIINRAHHLLDQVQNASLYFRNMILLHDELSDLVPVESLSLLSFDTSILQYNALSKLSSVVQNIERLEISSCGILMDEPCVLKLFLPFTAIHTLSLIIRPLLESNAYHDRHFENCFLENLELLKAVSLDGQYTLKIETREKTYIRQRKGGKILEHEDQDVDVGPGTKDNFFIWIKCLDLNEICISNDWNHEFEKLH